MERKGEHCLFHHSSFGFNFGGGTLIHYDDRLTKENNAYCGDGANLYNVKGNQLCGGDKIEKITSYYYFDIEEYEVFQINH